MNPPNSKFYILNSCAGQSLIEVLIAVTIGALIVGSAVVALLFTVRSNQQNSASESASHLAQELLDNVRSVAEGNWQSVYGLTKGSQYHLSGNPLTVTSGSEDLQLQSGGTTFTRYFIVENVNRTNCGRGDITDDEETATCGEGADFFEDSVSEDPSTQKVTVKTTWLQGGQVAEVAMSEYLTRYKNEVNQFTDWSGGSGVEGPITQPGIGYSSQNGLDTTCIPGSVQLAGECAPAGHWDKVDDVVADDLSTYVYTSSTTMQKDAYVLQDTSQTGTINSVSVYSRTQGCGRLWLRVEGVEYDGTFYICNGGNWGDNIGPTILTSSIPGGWTWANINNMQVVAGSQQDGAYNGRLTQIWVRVTYNDTQTLILRPNGDGDYTNIDSQFP